MLGPAGLLWAAPLGGPLGHVYWGTRLLRPYLMSFPRVRPPQPHVPTWVRLGFEGFSGNMCVGCPGGRLAWVGRGCTRAEAPGLGPRHTHGCCALCAHGDPAEGGWVQTHCHKVGIKMFSGLE